MEKEENETYIRDYDGEKHDIRLNRPPKHFKSRPYKESNTSPVEEINNNEVKN